MGSTSQHIDLLLLRDKVDHLLPGDGGLGKLVDPLLQEDDRLDKIDIAGRKSIVGNGETEINHRVLSVIIDFQDSQRQLQEQIMKLTMDNNKSTIRWNPMEEMMRSPLRRATEKPSRNTC